MPFFRKRPRPFPDLRKAQFRKQKGWRPDANVGRVQDFVPQDAQLSQKIGIMPNDKVLFFAGGHGDWANALSLFAEVHYTDISREMLDFVKQQKPGQIRSFRRQAAELAPRIAEKYDWSFSFEPYPIADVNTIPLVFLRALLNKKGAKMVFVNPSQYDFEKRINPSALMSFADSYGAGFQLKKIFIQGQRRYHTEPEAIPCVVITILTNSKSQKLAHTDLAVLHQLNIALKKKQEPTDAELAKKIGISVRVIQKSRKRLEKITPKWLDSTRSFDSEETAELF